MQFLDVVDCTDCEVVFTRQRQAVGELAGIERTHGIDLLATAQCKRWFIYMQSYNDSYSSCERLGSFAVRHVTLSTFHVSTHRSTSTYYTVQARLHAHLAHVDVCEEELAPAAVDDGGAIAGYEDAYHPIVAETS